MLWRKGNGNEERGRDFVFLLQHKPDIERADGKHETRINTLCDYGDPKVFSAMARLVDIHAVWPLCRCARAGCLPKGLLAPYRHEVCGFLMKESKSCGRDG